MSSSRWRRVKRTLVVADLPFAARVTSTPTCTGYSSRCRLLPAEVKDGSFPGIEHTF